jgi:hypothetical protein
MLERIRDQIGTAGLIVAVVALIGALGGGAYAATAGTSGKRGPKFITKSQAIAIAKKFAGQDGPAGPAGPQGPGSANGKDGANGSNGADGTDGESVEINAYEGEECEEAQGEEGVELTNSSGTAFACNGEEGSPWTAGGVLPIGATLKGVWAATGGSFEPLNAPISFDIPLSGPLAAAAVHYVTEEEQEKEEVPSDCTVEGAEGSAANPLAVEGSLCIFEFSHAELLAFPPLVGGLAGDGADSFGAEIKSFSSGSGAFMHGSWAVTAG